MSSHFIFPFTARGGSGPHARNWRHTQRMLFFAALILLPLYRLRFLAFSLTSASSTFAAGILLYEIFDSGWAFGKLSRGGEGARNRALRRRSGCDPRGVSACCLGRGSNARRAGRLDCLVVSLPLLVLILYAIGFPEAF